MQKPEIRFVRSNNDQFQILQALKENRRKRKELAEVFIEGIEPIKQAIAAGKAVKKIICADYSSLSQWAKSTLAALDYQEILQLENGLYQELSDKAEPSELMMTIAMDRRDLAEIKLGPSPLVLIFDRPSDHGNLGTIIRSANAFGVDLIITTGHGVDANDPKVIRSSLGAVFHTPIVQVESFAQLQDWLECQRAACGLHIIGTDSSGTTPAASPDLRRPCALILGNEAKGMSVALQGIADCLVAIPLRGQVNSLNVACAWSILLWQIELNSGAV